MVQPVLRGMTTAVVIGCLHVVLLPLRAGDRRLLVTSSVLAYVVDRLLVCLRLGNDMCRYFCENHLPRQRKLASKLLPTFHNLGM